MNDDFPEGHIDSADGQPPARSLRSDYLKYFDWEGLKPGDSIEVLDNGLVISSGIIEVLSSEQGILRLQLSYGRGERTFCQEDGWQVVLCRGHARAP